MKNLFCVAIKLVRDSVIAVCFLAVSYIAWQQVFMVCNASSMLLRQASFRLVVVRCGISMGFVDEVEELIGFLRGAIL